MSSNIINNLNAKVRLLEKKVSRINVKANKVVERVIVGPTGPSGYGKLCNQELMIVSDQKDIANLPFNLTINYVTVYGVSTEILSNIQSLPLSITLENALLGTPIGLFVDPDNNKISSVEPMLFNGNYVSGDMLTVNLKSINN